MRLLHQLSDLGTQLLERLDFYFFITTRQMSPLQNKSVCLATLLEKLW